MVAVPIWDSAGPFRVRLWTQLPERWFGGLHTITCTWGHHFWEIVEKCKKLLINIKYIEVIVKSFQNVKADHDGYTSPDEIDFMAESSKTPTAWIMTRGNVIHNPLYIDCKVVMLPQLFLPMPVSFAYPKNSSLALIVKHVFWKMQLTGVLDRIVKKYTPSTPDCRHNFIAFVPHYWALIRYLFRDGPYFEREAVSITKVAMATNLFGYGFAISWALFVTEIVYYNRMRAMRPLHETLMSPRKLSNSI